MTTASKWLRALTASALAGWLFLPGFTVAQPPPPRKPAEERSKDLTPFSQSLYQPTQPEVLQKFEAVQDYVKSRNWDKAARLLQGLLDDSEDVFLPFKRTAANGKEVVTWTSQRAEADRLLNELPADGRETYQFLYGRTARDLLLEARQNQDTERLAVVVQRYLHSESGIEATALLAAHHLSRGRPVMASLCYQRLLDRIGTETLPPPTLFQAAFAFEVCGERRLAERAWKLLAQTAPNGLDLKGQRLSLDDLARETVRGSQVLLSPGATGEWCVFRGQGQRQGQAENGVPNLESRWHQAPQSDPLTQAWMQALVRQQEVRAQTVLPGLFPVASQGRVFARTTSGLASFDLMSGKLLWESALALSFDSLASDPEATIHMDRWLEAYRASTPHIPLENSVIGTLSSDGQRVFAVDDLPLPPFPQNYSGFLGKAGLGLELAFNKGLTDAVYHSRLLAFDAVSGKALWQAGGRTEQAADKDKGVLPEDKSLPLHNSFLLGPPLAVGGKLYLISEKDQFLRLNCLEAKKGDLHWSQKLALSKSRMVLDGGRRTHAAHLANGEGLLICPTNAGAIIALDLSSHGLLWAHAYREEVPPPEADPAFGGNFRRRPQPITSPPNLSADWKTTAPIIAEGRVIFAAPDDPNVHCLKLRDGRPVWKVSKQAGELFLAAVVCGKVLLVGSTECRALNLEDGSVAWVLPTGIPAGQGVVVGKNYWLPIKAAVKDRQAGLAIIDLEKGELRDFLAAAPGEIPANLLIQDGIMISQGLDGLRAYPLFVEKPEDKR